MGRQISDIPGMPVGMTDVAQDSDGYLWISSSDGLSRYDGYEIRNWGSAPGRLSFIATGPNGEIVAGDPSTGFYEKVGNALVAIPTPENVLIEGPTDAVYDRDGILWAAWGGRVWRRELNDWVDVGGDEIATDQALSLCPRDDGGVILGSYSGDVWVIDAAGSATRIAHNMGGWVMQVHDDPRGPLATIRSGPRPGLVRFTNEGPEWLLEYAGRTEGLLRLGSSYWVAVSTGVYVLHDDGSQEFLSAKDGFTGFGNLSKDSEGGLWSASVRGLTHFPQPETRLWTELSGLPHVFLRGIHPVESGIVVTSWRGPMLLDEQGDVQLLDLQELFSRAIGCRDPWGDVWFKSFPPPTHPFPTESMLVSTNGEHAEIRVRHERFYSGELSCDTALDGSYWILADGKLFSVESPNQDPVIRGLLPKGTYNRRTQSGLLITHDGNTIFTLFYDGICQAPFPQANQRLDEDDWECHSIEVGGGFLDIFQTPSGKVWIAADNGGVLEQHNDDWRRVPGELSNLHEALALEPSPSGGIWVLGWRSRWRVEEAEDGGPPVIVESLGISHGVPDWQNGYGLHEAEDGTVWLPLYSGLVRVPSEVRQEPFGAPTVTVTSVVADGRRAELGERLALRHDDPSLEVRWSALSFRDPARVRYRMRLNRETEWSVLTQPIVQLAGMSSGTHQLELGASLDGRTWSEPPAIIEFEVRQAWYLQSWFLLLMALLFGAAVFLVYRFRVAYLLRLERQRTRIAMDLHDELGAGLGSTGLLVDLLADDKIDAEERHRIGSQVTRQLRDLGGALADIVWSLRPGTETLDALLLFLRQRAADLFPPEGGVRATVDAPDPCPALPLSLPQRRNLQWIAVEAMNNAARHAKASRVVIQLRPDSDAWVLSVRDNGCGLPEDEEQTVIAGLGRESMSRRAQEIGAHLHISSSPGEGTEVFIRFRPGSRKKRRRKVTGDQ